MDFEGGRLEMIGIRINGDNGDLLGKSVGEICESNPDFKFGIIAVLRNGKTIVPWSDFVFQVLLRAYESMPVYLSKCIALRKSYDEHL